MHLDGKTAPGSIVLVPFGGANSVQLAAVESVSDTKTCRTEVKPILAVPEKIGRLNGEMLSLCRYMTDTLLCSAGDAVKCLIPSGISVCRTVYYSINDEYIPGKPDKIPGKQEAEIFEYIRLNERVSSIELESKFGYSAGKAMKRLVSLGFCSGEDGYDCRLNEKNEKYAELNCSEEISEAVNSGKIVLSPKQQSIYDVLASSEYPMSVKEIMRSVGLKYDSPIKVLADKGVIRIFDIAADRSESTLTEFEPSLYGDFELSAEQNSAYEKLLGLYKCEDAKAALLWGVTGSGKTNVILKLIDRVVEDGKTAIVLVPEIALTPQTVGRFAARYSKAGIALLHSGLSVGEKIDARKKIEAGEAKIVIGTRSAVFAPVENLGLIVMDEEHEGTFKSDKSPKYHARDIARFRSAYNKALLVMASATPLVESFYRAKNGRYSLIELKSRYGGSALPDVCFYDMKDEPYFVMPDDRFSADGGGGTAQADEDGGAVPLILGKKLTEEISACLERKEQAMLFINRRGYRAFALCRNCGYTFSCPHCSVSMTYHKEKRTGRAKMMCHYCGWTAEVPTVCPECKKQRISFVGSGTQLLEETLNRSFPDAKVLRMDADTTSGKFAHEKILTAFRNAEADILVGTQMIAKGHDFPKVSLVGVALADMSLFVNDFRANEKTFSLLTQVLGRAGRAGTGGRAVLQTYVPDNDILALAAKQDYESFYEQEIKFRKANLFPPFCDIVNIVLSSGVESDLINAVRTFRGEIDKISAERFPNVKFILFGPFKSEIYRIAGKYRMRFIIKCRNTAEMRQFFAAILKKTAPGLKNTAVSADINPTNL